MRERPTVHVLIVEDDEEDYLFTHHLLKEATSHRFEVMWADRLQSALNYLVDASADVVLLDLTLPDSFGLDTFTAVRKQVPEIPIILLTGLQDGELGTRAVHAGAQDYLAKGDLSVELLSRSIDYAIERRRAQDALQTAYGDLESLINQRTRELAQVTQQLHVERTRRERAERMLRESRHLESICAFVESAAHRFGSSLAAICKMASSGADLAAEVPEVGAAYHEIRDAAANATQLSDRLVDISRVVGVGGGRPDAISLPVLVAEALREHEESLKGRGIQVKTRESGTIPQVRVDASQLREILSCLLGNAGRVLDEGGVVTLRVLECAELPELLASGRDTAACSFVVLEAMYGGLRAQPEAVDALLNSISALESQDEGGVLSGLGFAIVQSRARGWGGDVEIIEQGRSGGGVRLFLPVAESVKRAEESPASALVKGRRVIIVDDDELLLADARDALARAGYSVVVGTSPQEGVALLSDGAGVAAVLVDALLPDSGGTRLAGEAKRRHPSAAVIALSGFSRDILRGLLPASDWRYLQKPFDGTVLTRAVDDAIRAHFAPADAR